MKNGLLTLAKQPPENPASLAELERFVRYEMTPIDHDYAGKTSAMWNAAHRRFDITGTMAMMVGNPADTAEIVSRFKRDPKYVGGGVGAGFKERIIPHLDEVTELARAVGAVNIIKKAPDGRLIGGNTDGIGYAEGLAKIFAENGRSLSGAHVLMLGAGGSGRAIAFALAGKEVALTILNRTESKAVELAEDINRHCNTRAVGGGRLLIPEALPLMDAVVSVIDDAHSPLDAYSPLGDMASPVTGQSTAKNLQQSEALLLSAKSALVVSDIRLRNQETPMLAQATRLKLRTLSGIPMVVHQGIRAFWWLYQDELSKKGFDIPAVEYVMWNAVTA